MTRTVSSCLELPNLRLKLSGRGSPFCRNKSVLFVVAPARSLSAIR